MSTEPDYTAKVVGPRVAGGLYHSGYWGVDYQVLTVDGEQMSCAWADGKITAHRTAWDPKRDRVLADPATARKESVAAGMRAGSWLRKANTYRQLRV